MSTNRNESNTNIHSWSFLFLWVLTMTLPWSFGPTPAQGSTIYIDPAARTLGFTWAPSGLYIQFGVPGILQATADPGLHAWEGLSSESPYVIPAQELDGNRFFRVLSAARPLRLYVPSAYDPSSPIPLVILLHGFSDTGQGLEGIIKIQPMAEAYGFAYCYPDGTKNSNGYGFWNATGACCDFEGSNVDDVGYLTDLIECVKGQVNIDPNRVFLIGYSNGAFMAHRMAQEHSQVIAAVACLAGTISEGDLTDPIEPVNVLQVHGTQDMLVRYGGGTAFLNMGGGIVYQTDIPYLGAKALVEWWGLANGCTGWIEDNAATLDLSYLLGSPDTIVARWSEHPANGEVELWTIQGGGHWPNPTPAMWQLMVEMIIYLSPNISIFSNISGWKLLKSPAIKTRSVFGEHVTPWVKYVGCF